MLNENVASAKLSRKALKACLFIFAIYVVLFALVWGISSPVITSQLNKHLSPYKLTLSNDSQLQFNPFIARLSIKQLDLVNEDNHSVLKIGRMIVDLDVFSLFSREIAFDDFQLSDAVIEVIKENNRLSVIGIPLASNTNEAAEEVSDVAEPNSWQIVLANPKINNVVVDFREGSIHHPIVLTEANLTELVLGQSLQQFEIVSNYLYHDAQVVFDFSSVLQNGLGKVNFTVRINKLDLTDFNAYLGDQGKFVDGIAGLTLKGYVQIAQQGVDLKIDNFILNTTDVEFQRDELHIKVQSVELATHSLSLKVVGEDISTNSKLALTLDQVRIVQPATEHLIASFDKLTSADIQFTFNNDDLAASYEKLVIDNLVFSDKSSSSSQNENNTSLVALNQLAINNAQFTQDSMILERVFLDNLRLYLPIDEEKQLTNLVSFGNDTNSQSSSEAPKEPASATDSNATVDANTEKMPFNFKIDSIEIAQGSQIDIYDESVSPIFEQTLVIRKAQLSHLNSAKKSTFTTLLLDTDIGKHANIKVNSDIQPFAPKLNMITEVQLTELSLPKISSYMGKSLGLEFLSGQLDSDIKLNVTDDMLDGNALVTLRGMELAGTSHEKGNVVQESGMVPLNVALNMLKDSDDNVELNIPLSGNVNDPSFGVQSFVGLVAKKAIMSATESYLMQTFVPYSNIVSVARIAGEYMLRVTIDDLTYQPEQLDLSEDQLGFVENLVALLAEYPKKQLKVCAFSVPADIDAELKITNEEQLALVKLANERGQLFKDELVERFSVGSKRLLLCKPKVDTKKGAKPRIEFKL
ncbi:DUF748 domain-containing protein [Thalassotalea fusca]